MAKDSGGGDFMGKAEGFNQGLGTAQSSMGMMKNIGQLNAQSKFKRMMFSRTMEALNNKRILALRGADADAFNDRAATYKVQNESISDISNSRSGLRKLSASMNSLNSQVI